MRDKALYCQITKKLLSMNDALSFCTKGKKIFLQDAAKSFSLKQQPDEHQRTYQLRY